MARYNNHKNVEGSAQFVSGPGAFLQLPSKSITSSKLDFGKGSGGHLAAFIVKVVALETVRRVSKAKCPIVWTTLQGLQVFCYPPLKWVQCWSPLGFIVRGMQIISRPLLVLSVANAFSDRSDVSSGFLNENENPHVNNEVRSEGLPESLAGGNQSTSVGHRNTQSLISADWLDRLHKELEKQGIQLPERISQDLHRYYITANGDVWSLISSVKKTMRWRETYRILSAEELESWSNYIFWHGLDVKHRPCLFVRLGLAFMSLPASDRVRFTQALVSQVEYGIVQLLDKGNPQITVLVDCQGLAPLRFPMQTMRHCVNILKDHFPNVLGCMIIIRAPPLVRVIAHTFLKILRPSTRQKLRMEGDAYEKLITQLFQTLPAYLGGSCSCSVCEYGGVRAAEAEEDAESSPDVMTTTSMNAHCIRAAVFGILILFVLVAFLEGIYNTDFIASGH